MPIFLQRMIKPFFFMVLVLWGKLGMGQDSAVQAVPDTAQLPEVHRSTARLRQPVLRDSAAIADSVAISDSISMATDYRPTIAVFKFDAARPVFAGHPFFRFTDPAKYSITVRKWQGKEAIFYSMIFLLLVFALIKNGFYRYLNDLVKTFFRTTVKQRQVKEQLIQNPLPSMLLNGFFVLSIGMFAALLLQHFRLALEFNFWVLYGFCMIGLTAIYTIKFISLKLFGWIFQVSSAIDSYIFIVFATNKIIGIALLPFLVLLAFTYGAVNEAAMSLAIMVVLGLIAYRFFLSFISIRKQIRISFFHFFLYLIAFELVPLLLINKLLFRFLGETS
jgi:hypothetical protein